MRLAEPWPLPPTFFDGCRCALLADPDCTVAVASYLPAEGRLRLAEPLPRPPRAGEGVEVRSPEEAPVFAVRLALAAAGPLPPVALRLATTRGTNALLERRGARTALFISRGFGDLLRIGDQRRPDLFALDVRRPAPLYEAVVEVPGRLAADGRELRPLRLGEVLERARELRAAGVESAAVALLHSYRNPDHEDRLAAALRQAGWRYVSVSSELASRIELLSRAETAVVDAYLAPVVARYLERVAAPLTKGSTVHVMTSAGGLVRTAEYRPKDSLLSGPAGGVVGAARAGRAAGFERLISFDMGGTSTDVARWDGDYEYRFEQQVGGGRLLAPALAIETVAAGGGSLCLFDGHRLRVGPESAGASPGPACYGAGGALTVTDVNLLLGRLDPDGFEIPIDSGAAEAAFEKLRRGLGSSQSMSGGSVEDEPAALLEGLLAIADEAMADAIRTISVRRGYDPSEYALVAFGGAGAQHATAVAELLGIGAVVVPPDAALLSAVGLSAAVVERFAERQVLAPLTEVADRLAGWLDELSAAAVERVTAEGASDAAVRRRLVMLRFVGQESRLAVPFESADELSAGFRRAYRELYGYRPEERPIEVEALRVVASSPAPPVTPALPPGAARRVVGEDRQRVRFGGAWHQAAPVRRTQLRAGDELAGPALIFERHSATVVAPGWWAAVDGGGALVLRRTAEEP